MFWSIRHGRVTFVPHSIGGAGCFYGDVFFGGTTIDVVVVVFRRTVSEKPMLEQEKRVLKAYSLLFVYGPEALIAPDCEAI